MTKYPLRIGILICLPNKKNYDALKFLILYQNSIQESVEFNILPYPDFKNPFDNLFSKKPIEREETLNQLTSYKTSLLKWLDSRAKGYELSPDKLDGIIVISTAKFSDNYYSTGIGNMEILALGNWERYMAPPPLYEFILTQLVSITADIACEENFPRRHHTTKGCIFDFCSNLSEAKFKSLSGRICSECQEIITKNCNSKLLIDLQLLLKKNWLGKVQEPSYASITSKKLGYDLFHTKGISPTLGEKIRETLQDEIVKIIFKLIATLLIAALLLWLGLKNT